MTPARSSAASRTVRSAMFEATRYARGHKALYTLEINGEHASAFWDLHDLHRIQYFDHKDEGRVRGWRNIHVTDGDQPYMKHWWVPGLQIGYEHTFIAPVRGFRRGGGERKEPAADVPRRPGDRPCHRRGAGIAKSRRWKRWRSRSSSRPLAQGSRASRSRARAGEHAVIASVAGPPSAARREIVSSRTLRDSSWLSQPRRVGMRFSDIRQVYCTGMGYQQRHGSQGPDSPRGIVSPISGFAASSPCSTASVARRDRRVAAPRQIGVGPRPASGCVQIPLGTPNYVQLPQATAALVPVPEKLVVSGRIWCEHEPPGDEPPQRRLRPRLRGVPAQEPGPVAQVAAQLLAPRGAVERGRRFAQDTQRDTLPASDRHLSHQASGAAGGGGRACRPRRCAPHGVRTIP